MVSFHHKVVLIVGLFHSTGAEIAELLVDAGAEVVLADRNRLFGQTVAQRLGTAALFLPLDGSSQEDIHRLVTMTVDIFGKIDLLVIPPCVSHQWAGSCSTAS